MLTTTSAPLRTSPVKRGDWVLRRILGTPTPPPPADAGNIPADDKTFNGLTLRAAAGAAQTQRDLRQLPPAHRPARLPAREASTPSAAPAQTYADGKAVDVTGEFADKTTIVGADGLLNYLQAQDTQVMTTLSRKMLGYALGRTVLASDRPLMSEMSAAGGDASIADLAMKIVTSRQFRNRAATPPWRRPGAVTRAEARATRRTSGRRRSRATASFNELQHPRLSSGASRADP